MKIQLFIENQEIELNKDAEFAITSQFEDITNPSKIINEWGKTLEIPSTDRNDKIFGYIYNENKIIVDGGEEVDKVGVYFNPYLKLDMRLVYNSMVIMTGYAKMISIEKKNGVGTYNITLNGTLGKVFQEMKKITFDANEYEGEDKDKYYIDGSTYVDSYISKELVAGSWQFSGQTRSDLQGRGYWAVDITTGKKHWVPNYLYNIYNYIGFAPCNAFDDNFDYQTYQSEENKSEKFEDTLNKVFEEDYHLGIDAGSLIPNGMSPRGIGEFRSYLQTPYIWFNKLFKIFQAKAERLTGYNFVLDETWFNTSNPYWYNMVMMLSKLDISNGYEYTNGYVFDVTNSQQWTSVSSSANYTQTRTIENTINQGRTVQTIDRYDFDANKFIIKKNDSLRCNGMTVYSTLYGMQGSNSPTLYFNASNCLLVDFEFYGSTDNLVETRRVAVYREGTTNQEVIQAINDSDYGLAVKAQSTSISGKSGWVLPISISDLALSDYYYGDSAYFKINARWLNNENPVGLGTASTTVELVASEIQMSVEITDSYKRSFAKFTLNDLWNNDENIFDYILNYCKMYRIKISVDEVAKTINFDSLPKYFEDYTIEDWSSKVDFSRDYTITPITFSKKYILFNYTENSTKLGEKYNKVYGREFGEKRLMTEYNFSDDTEELFQNIKSPMVSTENILSWDNIYNGKIKYSFPAEILTYSSDKEGKFIDNFGTMYFFCGLSSWDDDERLALRGGSITDDTHFQLNYNLYFYNQITSDRVNVNTYPHLDIVYGNNLCTFTAPAENYTYLNNYSNKHGIYDNFWSEYINERYNVQNKLITCYLWITPIDYYNFNFNKFIMIKNQLYFVNKIYDYDMTSLTPTKVDLITIQDIAGYTNNMYNK